MLELYRTQGCSFSDEVEERLRALVVAHRVISIDAREDPLKQPFERLPVLKEGPSIYSTAAEIHRFLEDLAMELRINRTYQSDACFLDPEDGRTCL